MKDYPSATNLVDSPGQDGTHPRQEGQTIDTTHIDGQWGGQDGSRFLPGDFLVSRGQDQVVQPEVVSPTALRAHQQGLANPPSRQQNEKCQDDTQGLTS